MGIIAEEAVRIRADTSGFHREVQTGVMGSIGRVAGAAAAALGGLAIGKALFVDPIKSAGEFQQSLNVLQATSHATDQRMKEVSATAMKLGADTKLPAVSASDAAKAMLELAKGGFTAKESMEGARGVLLLSTAAQIDGAAAATLVADSLHAFGLRAKDAGVVVDDFAGAANASTATMGEVGQALQQSGQAFHGLGIPVGDAATAIAAMANAGIKGSDAGTSLKTMLQRLNPETKKAKQAFSDMGVSAYDSSGKFVGIRDVITQLGPKLAGMTQKQKAHTLATIFGSDASRAAAIVLGMTGEQWDKLHGKVTKAGQAQALADAQTKGFKGAMSALRSSIETVQLQIGLKMLPVLTTFVRFLSANLPAAVSAVGSVLSGLGDAIRGVADWLGIFQEKGSTISPGMRSMAASTLEAKTRFDQIVDAVRSVIGVITQFSNWISDNVGNIRQIAIAIAVGAAAFVTLTAAVRVYIAVQSALNVVMSANPIGLVIIAIAALVVGMTLLYQRSATARAIMDAAFNGMRTAATAVFGFMTNTLIPGAIAAWNRFGPGVVAALNSAVSAIRTVVQAIATVVRVIVEQIRAHWEGVWKIFGPIVTAQLQVVKTTVQTVLAVVTGVVKLFAALLRGDWSGAWNALKGIVSAVLSGIVGIVKAMLSGLAGTALALAQAIGSKIAAGIKTAAAKLVGLAGDLVGKISSAATQAAGQALTLMLSVGQAIADGVIQGIGDISGRVADKVNSALDKARDLIGKFNVFGSPSKLWADTIGLPIGQGVVAGVERGMARLGATAVSSINRMRAELRPVAAMIPADFSAMTEKAAEALRAKIAAKAKPIGEAFGKWASNAKAAFDANIQKLITGVDAQLAKAQAKVDVWKAKLTPTEALLAAMQARAAQQQVVQAVAAARLALDGLKAKQAADWAQLMATQAANMASLRASLQESADSAILSGNTFQKGMAAAAGNPFAASLIGAQQAFDATKAQFDKGLVDRATFIAAADALDAAHLAATNAQQAESNLASDATQAQHDAARLTAEQAANATTLLDQYNTWQTALAQQTAAGAAITTQEKADQDAQAAQQAQFGTDRQTAVNALSEAMLAEKQFHLEQDAAAERAARDRAAEEMSAGLKKRHDRILEHLGNVQHAWDLSYNELARMASRSGGEITNNIAAALRAGVSTVAGAAAAVAQVIKNHLALRSPAKEGPLSDLDTWWTKLAPTLVASLDTSGVKAALTEAVTPSGAFIGDRRVGPAPTQYPAGGGVNWQRVEFLLQRIEKHTGTTAQKNPAVPEIHVAGGVSIDASAYRSRR